MFRNSLVGDPQPGNHNDTIVYRSSGMNDTLTDRITELRDIP